MVFFYFRYKARNNNGQIGLVPRNYLQELTEYLAGPFRNVGGLSINNGGDSIDRRNDQLPPISSSSSLQMPPLPNPNHPQLQQQQQQLQQGLQMERPNLAGKTWYYGAITRNQCDTVLNQHGHDGDFLIRDSETNVIFFKSYYNFIICYKINFFFIL